MAQEQSYWYLSGLPFLFKLPVANYQLLLRRTRLVMSDCGFLVTIHSIMAVAKDKLYLKKS